MCKTYVVKNTTSILYAGQDANMAFMAMRTPPRGVATCEVWENNEYKYICFKPEKL